MAYFTGLLGVLFLGFSALAGAQDIPECEGSSGRALELNNHQVLQWKHSSRNQFSERGFVDGVVTKIYPDKTGHTHFAIDIDQNLPGDVELIYNDKFGKLPPIKVGMKVVACGDYITVGKGAKLPSPMGAIIHWLHYNPGDRDGGEHPHGFLVVEGKTYGYPSRKFR